MECSKQNTNNDRLFSYPLRSNANCKLCDENKGMPGSLSLFHRHQAEIEISQRKLRKMLGIPPGGKGKRKKVAEELPFMPALPKPHMKHAWIYVSCFPTQKLRNRFINKFQYTDRQTCFHLAIILTIIQTKVHAYIWVQNNA